MNKLLQSMLIFMVTLFCSFSAIAEIIYETKDPFGGFQGLIGADVYAEQSVAIRFTPTKDYSLNEVALWFMNNSADKAGIVLLSLRNNEHSNKLGDIPGQQIIEKWSFQISSFGWEPALEKVQSKTHPILHKNVSYWIVAESNAAIVEDPIWNYSSEGNAFSTYTDKYGYWQQGGDAAALTISIDGTSVREGA